MLNQAVGSTIKASTFANVNVEKVYSTAAKAQASLGGQFDVGIVIDDPYQPLRKELIRNGKLLF